MLNKDGNIFYSIGLDNDQLRADAKRSQDLIKGIGDSSVAEGARIDSAFKKIAGSIVAVFTIEKAAEFAKSIVKVRGEIESLEISFETLLGSKEKADALFSNIRSFAANTPMELAPLAKGAQTLLSFNIAGEKVMPILKQIGDISMGNSDKFNSLILAFSQMSSTGRLMGQDLLQMINAGFNPLTVIAEKTGKTVAQLKDEMSAGAISADMVADAFATATAEGGRFHGMLERQSKGINGSISNLKGAIDEMLNSIGASSQGFITSMVKGATSIVQHYQEIGEILGLTIATYGTYKAAVMATEAVRQSVETVKYAEEAEQLKQLLSAEQLGKISKAGLAEGSLQYSAAVKAEVASNIQSAQSSLTKARAEVSASSQVVTAKRAEYISAKQLEAQRMAELASISATGTAKQAEIAQRRLSAATTEKETAALAFQNASRDFSTKKLAVESAAKEVNTLSTVANTASQSANITATNILAAAKMRLTAIAARLNAVIMANPYLLAAAAVVALGYGIYKLVTYQTEAEKAQERLNDAVREAEAAAFSEERGLARLKGELSAATKGSEEYNRIKEKIVKNYGQYYSGLAKEIDQVGLLDSTYKKLTKSIHESFAARQYDKFMKEETEKFNRVLEKKNKGIDKAFAQGLGDEKGAEMYHKLQQELAAGKIKLVPHGKNGGVSVSGMSKELKDAIREATLKKQGKGGFSISGAIADILKAENELDETNKLAQIKTGLDSSRKKKDQGEKAAPIKSENYKVSYEKAKKEWADAKKDLLAIDKDKDKFTKEQFEKAKKRAETAKKAYEEVGGQTSKRGAGGGGIARRPKDYSDELKRNKQDEVRLYQDMDNQVAQTQIDLMKDGLEKKLAQNKLNFKKEMEQIQQQKEDKLAKIQSWEKTMWEKENPNWEKKGLKFKPKTTQLPESLNKNYKLLEDGAMKQFEEANKKAFDKSIEEYANFAQEYLKKKKEFDDNIKNLEKQGASAEVIANVKAMNEDALKALEEEMEAKEPAFAAFVESMANMGLEKLLDTLKQAKEALDSEKNTGGNDKKKIRTLQAQIKSLEGRITELVSVKDSTKEVKAGDPAKKWQAVLSVMADVKTLTNDVADSFDILDDSTKAVLNSAMDISSGVVNMISGIEMLTTSAAASTTATATTASAAIKGVERASVILAIIGAALQIAMAIANVLKNLFSNDKSKERAIKREQQQIDQLKMSYDKLGKAIEKSYSKDAAGLIDMQNQVLELQKKHIEEQIRLEGDKKHSNDKRIQELKKQNAQIDEQIKGSKERKIDAIMGKDIKSAIDEFADAYMNAWSAGEDRAKAMKDVAKNMIKSTLKELLSSKIASAVKAYREKVAAAIKDEIITESEKRAIDQLEENIYEKAKGIDDLNKQFGIGDEAAAAAKKREATTKGFASMSQDSANELNGRFTALQALTAEISINMKTLTSNSSAILKAVTGIKDDTKNLTRLENIERDMGSMKDSMSDLLVKGLKLAK